MPSLSDLAFEHQAARIDLGQQQAARAVGTLRNIDMDYLDASWDAVAPYLVDQVYDAQLAAADQATDYLRAIGGARGSIVPEAFAGAMIDGRETGPAMFGAITRMKTAIGTGIAPELAFQSGASFLALLVKTAIADAGRGADRVLSTAKGYTQYIRVVSPGACSRCALLAGTGSGEKAFLRHPACKCTAVPLPDGAPTPEGLYSSPQEYFDSLDPDEQDRIFTNAGAQAIRDGADFSQVVNARRGANLRRGGIVPKRFGLTAPLGYMPNGKPIRVFTTGEGTTVRAAYGKQELRRGAAFTKGAGDRYRRTVNYRLMPETIYQIAGPDRARAAQLLRQYGYIS